MQHAGTSIDTDPASARNTRGKDRSRKGTIGAGALALLVSAGQLKEAPALSWLQVDLTLASTIAVLFFCVVSRVRLGKITGRIAVPLTLWLIFAFAVSLASFTPHSRTKVELLFTVTLLCALAPFYLLRTPAQRATFLTVTVLIGVFTTFETLRGGGNLANDYSNRITLEGVTTIGTAQMTAAAALVCFVVMFMRGVRPIYRVILMGAASLMLYVALASGSRGPVVAVGAAVGIMLLFSPGMKKYRGRVLLALAAIGCVVIWSAFERDSDGLLRVLTFLSGESDASTLAREALWQESWTSIESSPFGIGWGNFVSGVFTYPHNLIVEVAVEAGVLVAVCVIAYILLSAGRLARLSVDMHVVPFLGLLVFSLTNAMVSSDINGQRLMWMMLSVPWVLAHHAAEQRGKARRVHHPALAR